LAVDLAGAGLVGAVLGSMGYLVALVHVPSIFTFFRLDSIALQNAVLAQFSCPLAVGVIVITVMVGLVEAGLKCD
jgi:hypothetical protein